METSEYSKLEKFIADLREMSVRVRKNIYKGKGRPKNSDYTVIKRKDLLDFYCFEKFSGSFSTKYTSYDKKTKK